MDTFTERLNQIMEEKKIRNIDLSRKSGLSTGAITQWRQGRSFAANKNLYKLAVALDVSEAWLMGYDVPKERLTAQTDEKIIYDLIDSLSEDKKQILLTLAKSLKEAQDKEKE